MAAVAGFFSTVATNTSNYSERLKNRSAPEVQTRTAEESSGVDGVDDHTKEKGLSPVQLEKLAIRMAHKTYEGNLQDDLNKRPALRGVGKYCAHIAKTRAERGRTHEVTSATIHYARDLTRTALISKYSKELTSSPG